jgi:small subunit ribosomal protein S9
LGTGRRKSSVARVFLRPGKGEIKVNNRAFENFFPTESTRSRGAAGAGGY